MSVRGVVAADPAGLALPGYRPRTPEHGALHRLVHEHLETFLAEARARSDGDGLPHFVERELREFLTCGQLARGFARFRCDACRADLLVAFSCKGRGFCPSCTARRMASLAAHLVDDVLGGLPVRQWVLTTPHRLRYALAYDQRLCRRVLAVFIRAVLSFERRRARCRGAPDGCGGAVTAIQRFGSAANLNVHFHSLVVQGVFAGDGARSSRCLRHRTRMLPAPRERDRAVRGGVRLTLRDALGARLVPAPRRRQDVEVARQLRHHPRRPREPHRRRAPALPAADALPEPARVRRGRHRRGAGRHRAHVRDVAARGCRRGQDHRLRDGARVPRGVATALRDVGGVLGILQREPGKALAADREARAAAAGLSDAQIDALLDERIAARKARDFKRADEIRGRLADAGIDLKDNPDRTTTWAARR